MSGQVSSLGRGLAGTDLFYDDGEVVVWCDGILENYENRMPGQPGPTTVPAWQWLSWCRELITYCVELSSAHSGQSGAAQVKQSACHRDREDEDIMYNVQCTVG